MKRPFNLPELIWGGVPLHLFFVICDYLRRCTSEGIAAVFLLIVWLVAL